MKFRLVVFEICGLILFCMNAQGQFRVNPEMFDNGRSLTGNFQYDIAESMNVDSASDTAVVLQKVVYKRLYSPLRAGLFSAVIPGAGQLYTKSYLKGSLFLGAEVLLWVLYIANENKGDDKTTLFQNYADENWSVVRYAGWINANFAQSIAIDANQNLKSWERVRWDELNTVEEEIGGNLQTTGFSHKLAPHGDQQYYEMIGKYAQFGGGWGDASTFQPGGFTKADVIANNGIGNVSPQFQSYSTMRNDANKFYEVATTVSYIIIANHIFSALEAAWNASKLNHKIKLQGHIESRKVLGNIVEFVPTLHLEYEL